MPTGGNLLPDGRFLPPEALRARYAPVLEAWRGKDAAAYCGSGVTATHDILAIAHAGLGTIALYPGSWSEWIRDPTRPVAKGPEP
jgi:thiosulfate/3-mercaptopyruvate sulfurtransferase